MWLHHRKNWNSLLSHSPSVSSLTLGKLPAMFWGHSSHLWRGPRSKELRPPVKSNVRESSSKQILWPQASLQMTVASANLPAQSHERPPSRNHPGRPLPNSWPTGTGRYKLNVSYFKPLCFGVTCYAAIDNPLSPLWTRRQIKIETPWGHLVHSCVPNTGQLVCIQ